MNDLLSAYTLLTIPWKLKLREHLYDDLEWYKITRKEIDELLEHILKHGTDDMDTLKLVLDLLEKHVKRYARSFRILDDLILKKTYKVFGEFINGQMCQIELNSLNISANRLKKYLKKLQPTTNSQQVPDLLVLKIQKIRKQKIDISRHLPSKKTGSKEDKANAGSRMTSTPKRTNIYQVNKFAEPFIEEKDDILSRSKDKADVESRKTPIKTNIYKVSEFAKPSIKEMDEILSKALEA